MSGDFEWITLSPKAHNPPQTNILQRCDELKVVVHNPSDLSFAETMAAHTQERTILLLQPGWGSEQGMRLAIDYVQQHQNWRLSLQTHKWLEIR